MIIKVIGCGLLIAVFSFAGFLKAEKLKKREYYIKKLEDLIQRLSLELTYSLTNLSEIFEVLTKDQNFRELSFVSGTHFKMERGQSFSWSFENSIIDEISENKDNSEELQVVIGLTSILGAADIEEQQHALELCQKRLHDIYFKAREEHQKKSKMYRSIGLLSGIMVALVLI